MYIMNTMNYEQKNKKPQLMQTYQEEKKCKKSYKQKTIKYLNKTRGL